ncbi:MAG: hypothetical protein J1E85_06360 [Ruminococcus sp.]|nr:hypothetical protein [Ruminococcus sp.]
MYFLFQKPIADAIKEKFNIDINNDEYKNTIFSVDSVQTEEPDKLPFDKTYKGDIMIFKNDEPKYVLYYILESHENIPKQSTCTLVINEPVQASIRTLATFFK